MKKNTWLLLTLAASLACASAPSVDAQQPPAGRTSADSLDPNLVPPGFGTLRQDDIAIKVAPANGLQVRAIPLDERFIRLLSPDSYRTLRDLTREKAKEIEAAQSRQRQLSYSLWYVSFFAVEQGETRFSPQEFIIQNVGRDFRPIDVIPLTGGFGEYRLRQREVQSAIYVFDGQVDPNQPITALMESTPSVTNWQNVLQRVERERALVRSRAAGVAKKDSM
jgi:hypothetical protein